MREKVDYFQPLSGELTWFFNACHFCTCPMCLWLGAHPFQLPTKRTSRTENCSAEPALEIRRPNSSG